ncbi:hypothetical protein [Streptomyces spiramenti]|uniref:Type VII secretion protein EccE n=1 Tax=Streptomyces spiramenti TaxID=2720606 RepID=A0ABX1ARV3_9ACTN|nr:hypothetical protein [Streptomyces spiramenti]NJP67428.1 hypothetical protein [Streptomyces spiramenti]
MRRTVDPFAFFAEHRDTIFRWCGILGTLLILFLLLRWQVKKRGGWRVVGRRIKREFQATVLAFAAPPRAWLRYRRALRRLTGLLGAPTTWRDAELAVLTAREAAAGGSVPYAVRVDAHWVRVMLAGHAAAPGAPEPPGPWYPDPDAPGEWVAQRADLPAIAPAGGGPCPVLAAVGERHRGCVFVDLATGPAVTSVTGDARNASVLVQVLGAQLDARMPRGMVTVAGDVHPRFPGEPVRDAYRAALAALGAPTTPRDDVTGMPVLPSVLIAATLPDPLPPELTAAPDAGRPPIRVLVNGPGRGHARRVFTDRHSRVAISGAPLLANAAALSRAVARTLSLFPPLPPPPPAGAGADGLTGSELFQEEGVVTGVPAAGAPTRQTVTTAAPAVEEQQEPVVLAEPEAPAAARSARTRRNAPVIDPRHRIALTKTTAPAPAPVPSPAAPPGGTADDEGSLPPGRSSRSTHRP